MTRSKTILVSILGMIVLVFTVATLLSKAQVSKHKPAAQATPDVTTPVKPPISFDSPVTLSIPKINVTAKVVPVGLTSRGDMDVPNNTVDVGWYKYGANPGNSGTAVIDGHLDSASGKPGVFYNLKGLSKNDKITVSDGSHTATFAIDHITAYNQLAHPEEVFNSGAGTHLNLITCTGSWDEASGRYNQRLVIFANLTN